MLKPLKSDLLRGVEHGFFTRLGGHSTGIYKGLNCGRGSEDEPANVRANRRAVPHILAGQRPRYNRSIKSILKMLWS